MSAVEQGNKIEAIKIVRQAYGLDLKDAKDSVDAFIAGRPDLAEVFARKTAHAQRIALLFVAFVVLGLLLAAWLMKG